MMHVIDREYLIEASRKLPVDKISIYDMDPTMRAESDRANATVVLLLNDKDELNSGISSKVLRTVLRPTENIVVTPKQYEQMVEQAETNALLQAKRILIMNGIPQHVADEYIKKCREQKTWRPK